MTTPIHRAPGDPTPRNINRALDRKEAAFNRLRRDMTNEKLLMANLVADDEYRALVARWMDEFPMWEPWS